MTPDQLASLPFVHRKDLDYDYALEVSLKVSLQAFQLDALYLIGATKAGSFKYRIEPTNNGAPTVQTFNVGDIPLWLSVVDLDQNYTNGTTFAVVQLILNSDVMHTLCTGYVGYTRAVTYPQTNSEPSEGILGSRDLSSSTDPAANVELSLTVPNFQIWKIRAVQFQLVTDATVANRTVSLLFTEEHGVVMECISPNVQAASLTRNYRAHPTGSGTGTSVGTSLVIPIPDDLWLGPGSTITTVTANKQATDNYGIMDVSHETYISG